MTTTAKDKRTTDALPIGEISRQAGLSVHALRFYEREGLFATDVERSDSGRRVYRQADVEWLKVCTRFRNSGMPISDIRTYAALVRAGTGNEIERFRLLQNHQRRIEAQLVELQHCHDMVSAKVTAYAGYLANGTAGDTWTGEPVQCTPPTLPTTQTTQNPARHPPA